MRGYQRVSSSWRWPSAYSIHYELFQKTELESKKYAEEIAAKIKLKITEAFEVTRSFARTLSQIKDQKSPLEMNREEVIEMMKVQFLTNPTIFGFNTGWEIKERGLPLLPKR